MAKLTDKPPDGFQPGRRGVTAVEVAESLTPQDQAAEIPSALGVPVSVGAVSVPPPSLVALALLEQLESPFLGSVGDLATMDVLRALYCLANPREAMRLVAPAIRSAAALAALAERARGEPSAWESYLDAVATSAAATWRGFDAAVAEFGESLGAADVLGIAAAIGQQVAIASRGYEMIPADDNDPKALAASELSASPSMP